jgi:hypothetical protein
MYCNVHVEFFVGKESVLGTNKPRELNGTLDMYSRWPALYRNDLR